MRGSDTLKFQISRLNGTNRNVCHSSKTAFINQPFAAPHQSAGSEVPSDSFPPGEAKGQLRKLVPFIERLNPVRLRADAIRPTVACSIIAPAHKYLRFLSGIVTGRVRKLTYRYKPGSVIAA